MRPRRARREELRVLGEQADREASAYVQTAMSFATPAPRLTLVVPTTAELVPTAIAELVPTAIAEPVTLPPRPEPQTLAVVSPLRAPVVARAAPVEEARVDGARPRPAAAATLPITFGLGVLVLGALVTRRRRRRARSRS